MKRIFNGEVVDSEFYDVLLQHRNTYDAIKQVLLRAEALLANKSIIMEASGQKSTWSPDRDGSVTIYVDGCPCKIDLDAGACDALKSIRSLSQEIRFDFNKKFADPDNTWHTIYPVDGIDEYDRSSRTYSMWLNPRRWEYVEGMAQLARDLLAKFE